MQKLGILCMPKIVGPVNLQNIKNPSSKLDGSTAAHNIYLDTRGYLHQGDIAGTIVGVVFAGVVTTIIVLPVASVVLTIVVTVTAGVIGGVLATVISDAVMVPLPPEPS